MVKHSEKLLKLKRQVSEPNKPVLFLAKGERGEILVAFSAFVQLKSADGKLGQDLTMRTGAACFSCDLSLNQLHDPENVKKVMFMNFLTVNANTVFEQIAREENVSVDEYDFFSSSEKHTH